MRTILVMLALSAMAFGPAAAQIAPSWDPVMAAQGTALTAMNRRNAQRTTGRSVARHAPRRRSTALPPRARCSDLASLRRRLGSLSRDDYMRYRACQGLKP